MEGKEAAGEVALETQERKRMSRFHSLLPISLLKKKKSFENVFGS